MYDQTFMVNYQEKQKKAQHKNQVGIPSRNEADGGSQRGFGALENSIS